MKGDQVLVQYEAGPMVYTEIIEATGNGQKVVWDVKRDWVTVEVVNKAEKTVSTTKFKPSSVLIVKEVPARPVG